MKHWMMDGTEEDMRLSRELFENMMKTQHGSKRSLAMQRLVQTLREVDGEAATANSTESKVVEVRAPAVHIKEDKVIELKDVLDNGMKWLLQQIQQYSVELNKATPLDKLSEQVRLRLAAVGAWPNIVFDDRTCEITRIEMLKIGAYKYAEWQEDVDARVRTEEQKRNQIDHWMRIARWPEDHVLILKQCLPTLKQMNSRWAPYVDEFVQTWDSRTTIARNIHIEYWAGKGIRPNEFYYIFDEWPYAKQSDYLNKKLFKLTYKAVPTEVELTARTWDELPGEVGAIFCDHIDLQEWLIRHIPMARRRLYRQMIEPGSKVEMDSPFNRAWTPFSTTPEMPFPSKKQLEDEGYTFLDTPRGRRTSSVIPTYKEEAIEAKLDSLKGQY